MVQKTFEITSRGQFGAIVRQIRQKIEKSRPMSVAAIMNSSRFMLDDARALAGEFRSVLPEVRMAGISALGLESDPNIKKLNLTILFFFHTQVDVIAVEHEGKNEEEIIGEISRKMSGIPDIRVCAFFPSGYSMNYQKMLSELSSGENSDIVFFGSIAYSFLEGRDDLAGVVENAEATRGLFYSMADGKMLEDGIVMMFFSGQHLQVYARQILGWKPIGARMKVSGVYSGERGEVVLRYINGKPAANIYKKYLGVTPNEHFQGNVSEFPLIVKRKDTLLARRPYWADHQGYLHFWGDIHEGETVQLSYANPAAILINDQQEAEQMNHFSPEALFLIVCANRNSVMGKAGRQELKLFEQVLGTVHYTYGGFEILRIGEWGGIFNSVIVAIGMKETEYSDCNMCRVNTAENSHIELNMDPDGPIPVHLRLINFMDAVTRDLKNMAKEADAANQAKSAFLSNMSHEIRTPINAVLGMDEMILRESKEKNIVKYAEDIRSAGNNLLGIVNDILDFSKIEAGKMDIIPVEYELSSVINDLYNMIRKRAQDKELELVMDVDPKIPHLLYGDEIRLKQVITNILTNAVKYTETGSITLQIGFREKNKDSIELQVRVKDTGIGIKKEDLKKLFSAFERIEEKRNRTIEGTGLGMSITQRLLGLMGSRLGVESEYNVGSTFYFSVEQKVVRAEPIGDFKEALDRSIASRQEYRVSFTAPKACILVVDDTVMNLTVIKNLLKKTKLSIDTAESGYELLDMIREKKYDLIFLDHRMPGMDGIETLRRMKKMTDKENLNQETPVIALTANAVSGAREEYLQNGFDDYLTKPVNSARLEQMIMDYLPEDKIEAAGSGGEDENSRLPDIYWQIPEIDVQKGLENCGDAESFVGAVRIYQESAEDNIEEIRRAYADKDYPAYTIRVHALKSSSRIIGAGAIGNLAERMETAGNAGDVRAIEENTGALLAMYGHLAGELSELEENHIPESEDTLPQIGPEAFSEALAALREIAGMFDYDSLMSVLGELENYRLPDTQGERMKKLKKAASKADWDKVQEILQEK